MALPDDEFKDLTIAELRAVGAMFAVDLGHLTRKADIIKEIEENGVTWGMYVSMLEPDADEIPEDQDVIVDAEPVVPVVEEEVVVPVESEPVVPVLDEPVDVLVKMIRKNWSYDVRGYHFTRQHPFALVAEDDADYLVEVDQGFRVATPKEVREFYPNS